MDIPYDKRYTAGKGEESINYGRGVVYKKEEKS